MRLSLETIQLLSGWGDREAKAALAMVDTSRRLKISQTLVFRVSPIAGGAKQGQPGIFVGLD